MNVIVTVKVNVFVSAGGRNFSPELKSVMAMLASEYVERHNESHGKLEPICVHGISFVPSKMSAIAQSCDYEGREPSLADAVAEHPELADAAAAVSGPGIESGLMAPSKAYAGGGGV